MIAPEIWFGIVMGFIVALWIEKFYINRASVLPNVAVIFFIMLPAWSQVNNVIKWYLLIGIFFGIIAIGYLFTKKRLPGIIYDITYPFYSGKTLMPLYTLIIIFREYFVSKLYLTFFWILAVIFILITWFVGVKYMKNDYPFKNYLE